MNNSKVAIVFPAYKEWENLSLLVTGLSKTGEDFLVIVCDDSGPGERETLEKEILLAAQNNIDVVFDYSDTKSGRGAAVRRGVLNALNSNEYLAAIIESDCDGSHSIRALIDVWNSWKGEDEIVIGSRYLRESQIIGWSRPRRIQSKVLNTLIPRILGIDVRDITNGLRLYSREAASKAYSEPLKTNGFIHLSEVALRLRRSKIRFREVPIIFEERIYGSSSVGTRELLNSLAGLGRLLILRFFNR